MGMWIGFVWIREAQMHGGFAQFYCVLAVLGCAVASGSLVAVLVDAIHRSGLSEKEACIEMDLSPSAWSNQKAGIDRAVSLQRVSRLPAETLQEFALGILEQLGVPKRVELGAAILLAQRPRMARAELIRTEAVG